PRPAAARETRGRSGHRTAPLRGPRPCPFPGPGRDCPLPARPARGTTPDRPDRSRGIAMNRSRSLALALPALITACAQTPDADLEARARAIHERVLTIDTHIDIPFNFATPEVDPGVRGESQVDLVKMEEGRLDAG